MTGIAPHPDPTLPTPPPRGGSSTARTLLLIGIGFLVLLLIAGVVAAVLLPLAFRTAVSERFDVAGSPAVRVAVSDASFELAPSSDGGVHVLVTGWAPGTPAISARTIQGRTTIEGGCSRALWFVPCSLHLAVTMPPSSDLTVAGTNGAIVTSGLRGAIDATTTNGVIDVSGASGTVRMQTTNGAIRLADAASGDVRAGTTNGAVDLRFTAVPTSVDARSTNGAVTVLVPGSARYAVIAHTTNGLVDTSGVSADPASPNRITAVTTNGRVRVAQSGP